MAEKDYVRTSNLLSLLKQTHLGGIINECVLTVNKGKGLIEAIDITNTVVFIAKGNIGSRRFKGEYGLGNLDMIIKFLSTMQDSKLNVKTTENRLVLARKDARRRLDYLLSQPQLIATRLRMDDNDEDIKAKFLDAIEHTAELDERFVKDFGSYMATLKTKIVTIRVDGDDVWFDLGPKSEHQFKLSLELEEPSDDVFQLKVNGEYLARIFSAIEFDDEEPTTINFGDEDAPIVITSVLGMWAVSPSEELEEE